MFHVKHSSSASPPLAPAEVGKALRDQLEPLFASKGLADSKLLDRIERFGATLALWGAKVNLTADASDPSLIAYHVIDSLMPISLANSGDAPEFDRMRKRGSLTLDVGSGAGYPGLILAAASSGNFVLTEPRRKRAHYLEAAAAAMGLKNVEVENSPAESIDPGDGFDYVTVKGVRVDRSLFATVARVLKLGGMLVVYSSASQEFDLRAAESVGLGHPVGVDYSLRRDSKVAEMTLATWIRL